MECVLWHHPRCSKSRRALELLREAGAAPTVRVYMDDPPDAAELRAALARLGTTADALVRRGEARFAELGLEEADDETLLAALAAHPELLQRPVFLAGDRAVVGRPPERVLELIETMREHDA
ncbi:MAG: arsenate reductase (glutaredoxin) [Pseudomonadales bacterium]|nr:arsenate reductase (glutaredoxin) [Pseudomonadales bacterium]